MSIATFLSHISLMSAEDIATARPLVNQAFDNRAAALAAATTAKPAAKRKATKAKTEDALLAPVDSAPPAAAPAAPAAAPVAIVDPSDPLRSHPSRLQTPDPTKCMGRRVVNSKWVKGTHKDEGGVKKFHPEAQCTSKPAAGSALCAKCQEQEALALAGKRDAKKWFGRLDQPLYEFACVIGCKQYMELYPIGIKDDPLSVPPRITAAPSTPNAAPAPAPVVPGAPKKPGRKPKVAAVVQGTAVADTAVAPVEAEWVTFENEPGRVAIRNLKTHLVYAIKDTTEQDASKMADTSNCLGRWDEASQTVDPYGVPDETESAE